LTAFRADSVTVRDISTAWIRHVTGAAAISAAVAASTIAVAVAVAVTIAVTIAVSGIRIHRRFRDIDAVEIATAIAASTTAVTTSQDCSRDGKS
jgi:hypothetical protein